MAEYPKTMRYGGTVVTVVGPPDEMGIHHAVNSAGRNVIIYEKNLHPIPSPDDPVEVVVKMTRAQRDKMAAITPDRVLTRNKPWVLACIASKEAEARD